MRGEVEHFLLDADAGPAVAEVFAQDVQLGLADGIKAHLVEEAQQPGLAVLEHRIPRMFQIGRLRPTSW